MEENMVNEEKAGTDQVRMGQEEGGNEMDGNALVSKQGGELMESTLEGFHDKDRLTNNNLVKEAGNEDIEQNAIFHDELAAIQKDQLVPVLEEELIDKHAEIFSKIDKAKSKGAFIPNNLTLIHRGLAGSKILAKRVSEGDALGDVALVFAYASGNITKDVIVEMHELLTISHGNFGETSEDFEKEDISEAKKVIKKVGKRVLKYWAADIKISFRDLMKLLVGRLGDLKVDSDESLGINQVYGAIYSFIEENAGNWHRYPYLKRKSCYALLREDMEEIALTLNTKVKELLIILKRNNLLHLQPSSIGYQSEVNGVGSCYCIKILAENRYEVEKEDINPDALKEFGLI